MEKSQNYQFFFTENFLDSKDFLSKICHWYFKTIQFVYDYYVKGCPCWGYQYPYETVPLIENLANYLF